jgi:hypothetical protein
MTALEHNKYLAIGFGVFAVLFGFTFLLLMLVTVGVFVALGFSFAQEAATADQAGIGILGGVFTVVFYVVLGLVLVLPTAVASRKLWKLRPGARAWGIIAAILVFWAFPVGTFLAIYALWFLFSTEGRKFYAELKPPAP